MSNETIPHRLTAKCILVGDAGVGKSSILCRVMGNNFNPHIHSTIGVEFGTTTVQIKDNSDRNGPGKKPRAIKLQIWDAAGQERFRSIVQSYYRNTAIVLLVFDLTDKQTLDHLSFWIDEIKRIRGLEKGWPMFYLIGNKTDLSERERVVFPEHIESLTRHHPIRAYREVSAKDGSMIDNIIQEIAKDVDARIPDNPRDNDLHKGIIVRNFQPDGTFVGSQTAVKRCC